MSSGYRWGPLRVPQHRGLRRHRPLLVLGDAQIPQVLCGSCLPGAQGAGVGWRSVSGSRLPPARAGEDAQHALSSPRWRRQLGPGREFRGLFHSLTSRKAPGCLFFPARGSWQGQGWAATGSAPLLPGFGQTPGLPRALPCFAVNSFSLPKRLVSWCVLQPPAPVSASPRRAAPVCFPRTGSEELAGFFAGALGSGCLSRSRCQPLPSPVGG